MILRLILVIQVLLIILKLCGVLVCPWLVLLSPVLIPLGLLLFFSLVLWIIMGANIEIGI